MTTARDKFWMFGVRAHQDDSLLHGWRGARNGSQITPAEGALMLDVPNMIMVNCDGIPVPFSTHAIQYCESFCTMQKVLWGATGSGGFRVGNEEAFICQLAEKYPNITGAFMDDFFGKFRSAADGERQAQVLLQTIRAGLDAACRPLELHVVWYTHEVSAVPKAVFDYIDGLTLWTWNSKELPQLEKRLEQIEKDFPRHQKMLGIYMYDFSNRQPVETSLMEHQCELGLRLLQEGRLDGMIFEANSVMGVGLPSELWLRDWLRTAKHVKVPSGR